MTKKITWDQMCSYMAKFNEMNGLVTKGNTTQLTAVVVITADTFTEEYSEKSRSYRVSSDNKAFFPNQCSSSIYADCLDGTENGVRLDWYIGEFGKYAWEVEYCYIVEDENGKKFLEECM